MKILITGAAGFIGSHLVEEALARGLDTWAGVRKSSKRTFLTDCRIRFFDLDFASAERMEAQLLAAKREFGGWDYIIHAAGVTKCLDREDFFRVNTEGTRLFVDTLRRLEMVPQRFVFVSSLSVYGAIREEASGEAQAPWHYLPIREEDVPCPNTAYGKSKREAERYLASLTDFPYVVLRPTGVYGPREKDYFLMAKSIQQHTDFAVGYKPQEITFVYVKDFVQAAFAALTRGTIGRGYFLSDGAVYNSSTFSDLLREELGHPWWIRVTAPLWVLRIICTVMEAVSHVTGKMTALNGDKYNILKQRNWQCDIEPARRDLGYEPEYPLARGVKETVAWYKQAGWIK
jgi:nucleoside-diphosphate-sugar epimerase